MPLLHTRQAVLSGFFALGLLACGNAFGGSIRYDLTSLLGEYRYDESGSRYVDGVVSFEAPFNRYSVLEARLVLEGRVPLGRARGDGILREATSFDLSPSIATLTSVGSTLEFSFQSVLEEFRLERVYPDPFVPSLIPLPNPLQKPSDVPPVTFEVQVSVMPAFGTMYPPLFAPPERFGPVNTVDGIIIDTPLIAEITSAYIILSGPNIVPEPNGLVSAIILIFALVMARYRVQQTCDALGQLVL